MAVATGMVALELGSDLTGSLRVPASFCGVYAHKPSEGLLPARGFAFPGTEEAPAGLPSEIGPIGHCLDDLSLALQVLAGPDAAQVAQGGFALPQPRRAAAKDWRVLVVTAHPQAPVAAEVRAAVEGAGQRLAEAGASVAHASDLLPDLAEIGDTYGQIVETVLAHLEPGGRSPLALSAWFDLMASRTRIRAQLRALFAEFDAVLCPSVGCAAFEHVSEPDFAKRAITIDGTPAPYETLGARGVTREPWRAARDGGAGRLHQARTAAGRADRRPLFRGPQHHCPGWLARRIRPLKKYVDTVHFV